MLPYGDLTFSEFINKVFSHQINNTGCGFALLEPTVCHLVKYSILIKIILSETQVHLKLIFQLKQIKYSPFLF